VVAQFNKLNTTISQLNVNVENKELEIQRLKSASDLQQEEIAKLKVLSQQSERERTSAIETSENELRTIKSANDALRSDIETLKHQMQENEIEKNRTISTKDSEARMLKYENETIKAEVEKATQKSEVSPNNSLVNTF
jgi:membrane protein involved in colicin uptake